MNSPDFVRFRCACGRLLQVREALAGGPVRCPACFWLQMAPPRGLAEATPIDEIPEIEPIPEGNFASAESVNEVAKDVHFRAN